MSRDVPEWAKVGVEVIESSGRAWEVRYGRIAKITAILGNGNARIEGSKSQWRIIHSGYLSEAGDSGYYRPTFHHLTDEFKATVAHSRVLAAAKKSVRDEAERLEALWRKGDEDEIIATAKRLASP